MLGKRRELFEIVFDTLSVLSGEEALTITQIMRRNHINNFRCKQVIKILLFTNWIEKERFISSDAHAKNKYQITMEGLKKLEFWNKEIQDFREIIKNSKVNNNLLI